MKTLKNIGIALLIVLVVFLLIFTFVFPFDTRLNVTYEAKYQEGNLIRIETVNASYPLSGSPDTASFIVFFVITSIPAVVGAILLKRMTKDRRSRLFGFVALGVGVLLLVHLDQISAMIESAAGTRPGDLVGFRILGASGITRLLWNVETFTILKLLRPIPGGAYLELLLPVLAALLGCRLGRRHPE